MLAHQQAMVSVARQLCTNAVCDGPTTRVAGACASQLPCQPSSCSNGQRCGGEPALQASVNNPRRRSDAPSPHFKAPPPRDSSRPGSVASSAAVKAAPSARCVGLLRGDAPHLADPTLPCRYPAPCHSCSGSRPGMDDNLFASSRPGGSSQVRTPRIGLCQKAAEAMTF